MAKNSGLNIILIGKGQEACRPVRGEEMIFKKDEWALRRIDKRHESL